MFLSNFLFAACIVCSLILNYFSNVSVTFTVILYTCLLSEFSLTLLNGYLSLKQTSKWKVMFVHVHSMFSVLL